MQPQPHLPHALRHRGQHRPGLFQALAVDHHIVGVTLKDNPRKIPGKPCIERVVHEQISQPARPPTPEEYPSIAQ